LVQIIVVQSIARRFLSKSKVAERQVEVSKMLAVHQKKERAATIIQTAWRGFWGYSHYVIVLYEITRIQALMRRRLAKRHCNIRLACLILIQAAARRFLASKVVAKLELENMMIAARGQELRERNSAKRIQFWWRIVLDWTKEKKAALTIERFFIFVKAEVDREIRRREMKRLAKEKRRRERRRQSEDALLENVWMNTVSDLAPSSASSEESHVSKSSPYDSNRKDNAKEPIQNVNSKLHLAGFKEPVASSERVSLDPPCYTQPPSDALQMAPSQDFYPQPPTDAVQLAPSQDFSVVSNITNPSVFHKMSNHQLQTSQTDATDEVDFDFNQSLHKEVRPPSAKNEKKHRLGTEDYIRKYSGGLKTAPNRLSQSESSDHFFSEFGIKRQSSNGTLTTYTQSHTQASTPRNKTDPGSSSKRRNSSGTQISISIGRRESYSPHFLPPVTPLSRQKGAVVPIGRRGTSDTESQTTVSDSMYSRSSPRRHSTSGGIYGRGGNNPVMIMKTYPDLEDGQSVQEAHEVLLLGDEYGEV
jgi:hypothetical protein